MCDHCPHINNGICTKYRERLKISEVVEDRVIFEKAKGCEQ